MAIPGQNPAMAQAPANTGPVAVPQANHGNMAAAMNDLKNAAELLQKALPSVPMGSPVHNDIMDCIKKLTKHSNQESAGGQGGQLQSLLQMAKQAAQSAPMNAMARMFPAAPPNSPPAMPEAAGAAA